MSVIKLRERAFERQDGLCFYCRLPMWTHSDDVEVFAELHGLTIKSCRLLQCTAEHVIAQQDGGADRADNVVAACLFCNGHRHAHRQGSAPDAETFLQHVRRRMAQGAWHPALPVMAKQYLSGR